MAYITGMTCINL